MYFQTYIQKNLINSILNQKGFSLLEISIALAIISLITATVLTGQSMKRRLELNQVVENIGNINTAIKQFNEHYHCIPGDCYNATELFGIGNTSNGNGDNALDTGTPNEELLFWQQLALAGLINGSYDGISDSEASRMHGWGHSLYAAHKAQFGNVIIEVSKAGGMGWFSGKEAFELDTKYDDGKPTTGSTKATDSAGMAAGACVSSNTYNMAQTGEVSQPCVLYFDLGQ